MRKQLCLHEAERLRQELSMSEPPISVHRIAAALLIPLRPVAPWTWRGRALLSTAPLEITYNPKESHRGLRFSIAHEIGHFVLHPHGDVFSAHEEELRHEHAQDPDKELEDEADYFASVLLVPPAWLKADVAWGLSPDVLVDRYDVSRDVMFIALKEHRLLNRVKTKRSV
ncbi:MAG: ImmA/IrrE family metallo-endopeptidase [Dehalococcoidia bacterium]